MLIYDFNIRYIKTKSFGQVDVLSRLITNQPTRWRITVIAQCNVNQDVEFVNKFCFSYNFRIRAWNQLLWNLGKIFVIIIDSFSK